MFWGCFGWKGLELFICLTILFLYPFSLSFFFFFCAIHHVLFSSSYLCSLPLPVCTLFQCSVGVLLSPLLLPFPSLLFSIPKPFLIFCETVAWSLGLRIYVLLSIKVLCCYPVWLIHSFDAAPCLGLAR